MRNTELWLTIGALAGGLIAAPTAVHAFGGGPTDSVACGSMPSGWDAPKGAVVTSSGDGPIKAVITAIGEWRSHSMISHGVNAWVTHSTAHNPGLNDWGPIFGTCDAPIRGEELARGYPGLSQVSGAAIAQFLKDTTWIKTQISSAAGIGNSDDCTDIDPASDLAKAQATADWLWYDSNYQWADSQQGDGHIYIVRNAAGNNQPYVFYGYKNIQARHLGGETDPEVRWNGTMCSSAIAWAYRAAHPSAPAMATKTYSHDRIVAAGNALYENIENMCENNLGSFTEGLGCAICFDCPCDNAARQVRSCMAGSNCYTTSNSAWNALKDDPNSTATSLSPDQLVGWAGLDWCTADAGPWAPYGYTNTNFNGSTTYGCWF